MEPNASFFTNPIHDWQRKYEALRASFVERLPTKIVAERFGYSPSYIHLLRHQFKKGEIDFSEPVPEGKVKRRRVNNQTRIKITDWREKNLSAGEITQLLSEEGADISVRTVERVLAEEGFPRLPRRTRLKIGLTVKGAQVPQKSEVITTNQMDGESFQSDAAGIFIFAPFIEKLNIPDIVKAADLPGTKVIPATNYFLSFLALKLLGTERYAHVGDHAFDRGLGLFAGLNVLPKCTAMSTYSYSLDEIHITRLQEAFINQISKLHLYTGHVVNLDFHTVPHFGEESVLEDYWVGVRNKRMKGALTLFAQDAESKLILYTDADIRKSEAEDQVFSFLSFWRKVCRGVKPTLVFDSKFTTYSNLSRLNDSGVKFITLRRRGKNLIKQIESYSPWKRIRIPHEKRKFPNPLVHESKIMLQDYGEEIRQVVIRGNGHEKPTFLITNDFDIPVELLVGHYARRWRVENGISEAVKFFSLNALSSPILTKIHFDVALTMIADTLYHMLAQKLRRYECCDAQTLFRHFIRGKGMITIKKGKVVVNYPRKAHNPILRTVPWIKMPNTLTALPAAKLTLVFK
ncbi:MAG: transposase [Candidatus Aminicenantes bacterium]|nr:MAG: transposase [Candidatus Aminicenantes bacterium]